MTLLTVNYRRPVSLLQHCGLFSSDLALLHSSSAAVFGRIQHQHILKQACACKETQVG